MQAQLSQDLQRMTREKLEIQNQLAVVRGEQDHHQVLTTVLVLFMKFLTLLIYWDFSMLNCWCRLQWSSWRRRNGSCLLQTQTCSKDCSKLWPWHTCRLASSHNTSQFIAANWKSQTTALNGIICAPILQLGRKKWKYLDISGWRKSKQTAGRGGICVYASCDMSHALGLIPHPP